MMTIGKSLAHQLTWKSTFGQQSYSAGLDSFIISDAADVTIEQRSNLKFHLSMLVVDSLNGGPVKRPQQLRAPASRDASFTDDEMKELFEKLKRWANDYLKTEGVILERAAKAQSFSQYLLRKASEERASAQARA